MSDGIINHISRRRFLQQAEHLADGVAAVALCGALPVLLSACGAARGARIRYVPTARDGDRLTVRRAEVPDTGGVLLEVAGTDLPLYLRRDVGTDGADRFSAVSTRCMHRGCQVEPTVDRLACPCHGSEYTFAGDVLRGPTEQALVKYRVSADAVNLYVHLPAPKES